MYPTLPNHYLLLESSPKFIILPFWPGKWYISLQFLTIFVHSIFPVVLILQAVDFCITIESEQSNNIFVRNLFILECLVTWYTSSIYTKMEAKMESQPILAGIELKLYRLLIMMNFQGEMYACLSYTADYEQKKNMKKIGTQNTVMY